MSKITANAMAHVIKAVTFTHTVRLGHQALPFTDIYLNRNPEIGGNTMIDEASVRVSYSDDPRFLEVHTQGKRGVCIHLIPLSNVACILTEAVNIK